MKKTILILSIIILVLILNKQEYKIPKDSIRFRVIANSNNVEDQELKRKVVENLKDNLIKGEKFGSKAKCDGFIDVLYLGVKKTTKVVKMVNETIVWNQSIKIPVIEPAVSQKLVMIVQDKNKMGKPDIVGSIELYLDDIKNKRYEKKK